jgi:tRNA(Ile)-lysidine synthase
MGRSKEAVTPIVAHALSRLGVKSGSRVLAAVSGGVDSMTLGYILNELRKQGHLKKLALVHINHSLRGKESDKDELLVTRFAKKLDIPVYSFTVDTHVYAVAKKIGIEEAARTLRYEKFAEVAKKGKFQFIATAHTANDQAETVLMNIVRGSGLNGVQGIPESRNITDTSRIIRPILGINKKDVLAYAAANKIPFREDQSNDSLDFQRNRIRHLVLPRLEKAYKDRDIYSGFAKMSRNISAVADYLEGEVAELRKKIIAELPSLFIKRKITSFDKEGLLQAPVFLRRELILREASALQGKLVSLDHVHSLLFESYLNYESKTHKSFSLTPEIIINNDGKVVAVEVIDNSPNTEHVLMVGKKVLTPVGTISLKKVSTWEKPKDPNTAYFNFEKIKGRQLAIRYWKTGDRMKPFGMKGKSKLVSDILNEAGIKSQRLKYFVPLVVFKDEPDLILWIPGIRSAEFGSLDTEKETALELRRIL